MVLRGFYLKVAFFETSFELKINRQSLEPSEYTRRQGTHCLQMLQVRHMLKLMLFM